MSNQDNETELRRVNIFDRDEVDGVLKGSFYSPMTEEGMAPRRKPLPLAEKPTHYKVICISMYMQDLEHLDGLVGALKSRGLTKANRSSLIRAALNQIDLDKVPRGI